MRRLLGALASAVLLAAPGALAGGTIATCGAFSPLENACRVGPFMVGNAVWAQPSLDGFVGRLTITLEQASARYVVVCHSLLLVAHCEAPQVTGAFRAGHATTMVCEASARDLPGGVWVGPAGTWACTVRT